MIVHVDPEDVQRSLLGLVVALVEIVTDTLRTQALRRMDGGGLTDGEVNRLGEALLDLDGAIERLKLEMNIADAVDGIRRDLDRVLAGAVESAAASRWGGVREEGAHGTAT